MERIFISGTGLFLPPNTITNEELADSFNQYIEIRNKEFEKEIKEGSLPRIRKTSPGFIEKVSGIENRYVVNKEGILDPHCMTPRLEERAEEETSLQCEMAVAAAKEALQNGNHKPEEIDCVIAACSNFQRAYPALSIEIQNALGVEGFAFDLNVACSSATFALQVAYDTIRNGHANSVLVVNPEICSGHLNFRDRESHFIFGDACTAMLIENEQVCQSDDRFEIISTKLLTQYSNNIRNNNGFLNRCWPDKAGNDDKLFHQQGTRVFRDVVPLVVKLIGEHLTALDISPQNLKRMWLHQANIGMNQMIAKKLLDTEELSPEMAPDALKEVANTSSAGSIIVFHRHHNDLQSGDLGVICSFGAGYSIGNVVVRKV